MAGHIAFISTRSIACATFCNSKISHALCSREGVHNKALPVFLILLMAFGFSSCAYTTASGRREMAYRHYVQKQIKQHKRAMARAQKAANRELKLKIKSAQPSEPQVTTTVENVSESSSEPVAPPVTVSASGPIASESDNEPAQP